MTNSERYDKWVLIEFNSWETKSGAFPFDWILHTNIMYNDNSSVVFRSKSDEIIIDNQNLNQILKQIIKPEYITDLSSLAKTICVPENPSNYLVTEKYIYITTDIWIGVFDRELNNKGWKRGIYRFEPIYLVNENILYAGGEYLDLLLGPIRINRFNKLEKPSIDLASIETCNKYGFYCMVFNKEIFCRMNNEGQFYL
jgi:hypothetical protein